MTDLSKPPRPDVVLLDWDGTLADSFSLLYAAYKKVTDHFGMTPFTEEEVRLNTRRSSRDIFPELFGERAAEAADIFYTYVRSQQLGHLSPKEGAEDCLARLASMGIRMGIVSNMNHDLLCKNIGQLGWDRYIPVVLGAGQAERDKPAPDPLLLACSRLEVDMDAECVWYIGDTETDMMAARDAGVVPVLIGHGARTLSDCQRFGLSPFFTENFASLIRMVEK